MYIDSSAQRAEEHLYSAHRSDMAPVGNERATCVQAGSLCKTPANFADQKPMKFSEFLALRTCCRTCIKRVPIDTAIKSAAQIVYLHRPTPRRPWPWGSSAPLPPASSCPRRPPLLSGTVLCETEVPSPRCTRAQRQRYCVISECAEIRTRRTSNAGSLHQSRKLQSKFWHLLKGQMLQKASAACVISLISLYHA